MSTNTIPVPKIEVIPPPLSTTDAVHLWLALAQMLSNFDYSNPEIFDPFTPDERALYDALTKRLTHDASIASITATDAE